MPGFSAPRNDRETPAADECGRRPPAGRVTRRTVPFTRDSAEELRVLKGRRRLIGAYQKGVAADRVERQRAQRLSSGSPRTRDPARRRSTGCKTYRSADDAIANIA